MRKNDTLYQIAKKRDDGRYTYLGMVFQCASYLNIDIHSEEVSNIVDMYLMSSVPHDFFEWLRSKEVDQYVKEKKIQAYNEGW